MACFTVLPPEERCWYLNLNNSFRWGLFLFPLSGNKKNKKNKKLHEAVRHRTFISVVAVLKTFVRPMLIRRFTEMGEEKKTKQKKNTHSRSVLSFQAQSPSQMSADEESKRWRQGSKRVRRCSSNFLAQTSACLTGKNSFSQRRGHMAGSCFFDNKMPCHLASHL